MRDALLFARARNRFADLLGLRTLAAFARLVAADRGRRCDRRAGRVVHDLRVDLLVAAEHGEARTLGRTFDLLTDPQLAPRTSFEFRSGHLAIPRSYALLRALLRAALAAAGLACLLAHLLARVTHALALV